MKKIIVVFVLLAFAGTSFASVPFYNARHCKLIWQAVTKDEEGNAITGVSYRLWFANADTDATKKNPVVVWNGTALTATVTITEKGRYFVGVQAFHDGLYSDINWGDEPANQEGFELFGIRFAVPPATPKGLQRQ
jgi:hypothetical protein